MSFLLFLFLYNDNTKKLLGRSTDVGSFVKHGSERSFVEIELSGGGGGNPNVVIRRDIKIEPKNSKESKGVSEWRINGNVIIYP